MVSWFICGFIIRLVPAKHHEFQSAFNSIQFDRAACALLQSARSKLEPPHYDGVQSLALKGNYLFSGSRDNSIKKWNIETQQLIQVKLCEK